MYSARQNVSTKCITVIARHPADDLNHRRSVNPCDSQRTEEGAPREAAPKVSKTLMRRG